MKFATRTNLGLNRPPAIWFLNRFVAPEVGGVEIVLLPMDTVLADAARLGATVFHVPGVKLHMDKERGRTTLDALVDEFGWRGRDAGLERFCELIRDATYGVPAGAARFPESHGIRSFDAGFRLTHPDDRARIEALSRFYDAVYAWCCASVAAPAVAAPTAAGK